MPQTATQTKPAHRPRSSSGWSPERRAKHAAAIRIWAPWTKSTGPKTPAGKARVSRNALRQAPKHLDPDRIIEKALRQQARYLTEINRYSNLKKNPLKNKLLKDHLRNRRKALEKRGRKVTNDLISAFVWYRLVQMTSSHPPHHPVRTGGSSTKQKILVWENRNLPPTHPPGNHGITPA